MGRAVSDKIAKNVKVMMDDGDTSTLDIHQGPPNDRILILSGDIKEQTVATTIAQIIALDNQNSTVPIQLVINTYGGSVDEMFALYDTIKFVRSPIHTLGLGKIMSAGVLLLSSGRKGYRMIAPNARFMIHPISAGATGNIFDIINEVEEMKRHQMQMDEAIMRETGMSKKKYVKLRNDGRDIYLTAQQAVELGFADKVMPYLGVK
jgi:ATP-dependent Clp protease protease subunit